MPASLRRLDPGERASIALVRTLGAGLLLIDDRAGAAAARELGFRVAGTIGVLIDAPPRIQADVWRQSPPQFEALHQSAVDRQVRPGTDDPSIR